MVVVAVPAGVTGCQVYDPWLLPDAVTVRGDAVAPPPDSPRDNGVVSDTPVPPVDAFDAEPPGPDVPPTDPDAAPDVVSPADATPDVGRDAPPVVDVVPDAGPVELLTNGSFEGDATTWRMPWYFQSVMPGMGTIAQDTVRRADGMSSARISVTAISAEAWNVQLGQAGINATSGRAYAIRFAARAEPARMVTVVFQRATTPWTSYFAQSFVLDATWRTFALTPRAATETTTAQVVFNLADATGDVWIDRVSVTAP